MQRMIWIERVESLTEKEFKQRYRLTKDLFEKLVSKIKLFLTRRAKQKSGKTRPLKAEFQLSMTLRFLAGGAACDIQYIHTVGRLTFYKSVWRTVCASSCFR